MSTNGTQINIAANSSEVVTATKALDDLGRSGANAASGAQALTEAIKAVSAASSAAQKAINGVDAAPLQGASAALNSLKPTNLTAVSAALAQSQANASKAGVGFSQLAQGANATTAATKLTAYQLAELSPQLQDFFIQIQGGQSALTAFAQQFSQLASQNGGIKTTFQTYGAALLRFVTNPFVLAAAAVAAVVASFYQAATGAKELDKQLLLTGQSAGLNRDAFNKFAETIASSTNASIGSVRDLSLELVKTGQFSKTSLSAAAEAAVAYSKLTGDSLEDTGKAFTAVQDGAFKFASALAKNTGDRVFTAAQLDRIRNLEQEGKKQEAVTLTLNILRDSATKLTPELSAVGKAFNYIGEAISSLNRLRVKIFEPDTVEETLAGLEQTRKKILELGGAYSSDPAADLAKVDSDIANARSKKQLADSVLDLGVKSKIAGDATKELNNLVDAGKSPAARLKEELGKVKTQLAAVAAVNPEAAAKLSGPAYAAAYQKFGQEVLNRQNALSKALGDKAIADVQNTISLQADALNGEQAILEANRAAGLVSDDDYYAQKRANVEALLNDELRGHAKRIEYLNQEKFAGQDAALKEIERQKEIASEETKAESAQIKANTTLSTLRIQQTASVKALSAAYKEAQVSAAAYLAQASRRADADVGAVGQGDQEAERTKALLAIQEEGLAKVQAIEAERRKATNYGETQLSQGQAELFAKRIKLTQDTTDKEVAIEVDKNARIDAERTKANNGATAALENYLVASSNVAEQTKNLYTNAFNSIEDALVSFTTTGKISFTSFATSLIGDLARIQIKAAATAILNDAGGKNASLTSIIGSIGKALIGGGSSDPVIDYNIPYVPGRAIGGPVSPNSLTRVNENSVETFESAGKQYLLSGSYGTVKSGASGGGGDTNITVQSDLQRADMVNAIRSALRAYDQTAEKKFAKRA